MSATTIDVHVVSGVVVDVLGVLPTGPQGPPGVGVDVVEEVVAGAGISVDSTDPNAPIVTAQVTQAELDAEAALARNADNLTSGTVADARIASTIARDSEVTAAIAALSAVYQPLDSDLTAIAALTTTAYGRAFLALADAAAGRTALGLGTAAVEAAGAFDAAGAAAAAQAASQPLDSDLTAIAALTTTAFGRGLLALADAAALRTSAGLVIGTDVAAASEPVAAAHISDTADAHDASAISFAPAGSIAATTVQAAIEEVAAEAGSGSGTVESVVAGAGISVNSTDPGNPVVTAEVTQAELDAHVNDTSDAHDASAISSVPAGNLAATDVQAALNELDTEKATTGSVSTVASDLAAHLADTSDAHDASAISIADAGNDFTATDVEGALAELQADHEADATALSDHIADTTAAHAATAIAFTPAGTIAATTVQAAIEEVASEAGGGGGPDVYVFDGTDYEGPLTRLFFGSPDPEDEGFTGTDGDGWIQTGGEVSAADLEAEETARVAADAALDDEIDAATLPPVTTVAASGSTETLNWGTVYDVTMDQNCTFSFANPPGTGFEGRLRLILRGSFTPTWPAAVDWPNGSAPTYGAPAIYEFLTVNGGTVVFGFLAGKSFS